MLIELAEEQLSHVAGGEGDTYHDMGVAVGQFSATYAPYVMGATSYAICKVVALLQ